MMRSGISDFFNRRDIGSICGGRFLNGGAIGFIGMIFGWLVFLGLVALLVILIVKTVQKGKHYHPVDPGTSASVNSETSQVNGSTTNALAILNERYAKGEVNQEEYLIKKADILK